MKLSLTRAALLKPLQIITGVVEKRQTLPILSNVLVTVTENTLALTATDLEIELIGIISVDQVAQTGKTTVAARKLLDICRALPDDADIKMALEGEQLVVRSGGSRFALTTLPALEFPNFENGPFVAEFAMSEGKLRKLIGKAYFAMGQQDVRHYLNGALFDVNDGSVKCIATDGHRLAYSVVEEDRASAIKTKVILPRKSVLELVRLLDSNSEADVTLCIGESHFRLVSKDFTFTSKLINAQYPDYDKLIPRTVENTAVAGRESFKQALVRASILSNEKFRGIRLQLDKDVLRIVANNPEQEEAEETITLEYQGNGVEMGFNAAYLLDVISAIATDKLSWSFNDPNSGVLIEPALDKGQCMYVVMPMRL